MLATLRYKKKRRLTINPFVSEAQRRACYAKSDPGWDCSEWESHTPKGKKLPSRKSRKKKAVTNRSSRNLNPLKLDPTRTTTLRRAITAEVNRRFAVLKGKIIKLIVDEDVFGLREAKHDISTNAMVSMGSTGALGDRDLERDSSLYSGYFGSNGSVIESDVDIESAPETLNVFCPTGKGGGIDSSCGKEGSNAGSKVSAILDRVKDFPRSMVVRIQDKVKGIYSRLESRYGPKYAKAIVITGLAGLPIPIPFSTAVTAAPAIALAEMHRYFSRVSNELVVNIEMSQAEIEQAAKKLIEELEEEFRLTANTRWIFHSDSEKINAFQAWLKTQLQQTVIDKSMDELWQKYAEAGYKKGAGRAFDDVKKSPRWGPHEGDFYKGSKDQFLRSSFGSPVAIDKIKLLAGRSFDDLEGITSQMSLKMSRELTDGLVEGKSPRDIAKDITDEVDISKDRALTTARTEIIRAHAEGQLDAMENLGVEEVGVAVEWSTSGLNEVDSKGRPISPCEECIPMEGVVLKIDEARGMIPRHPNCRCSWTPANVGEDDKEQKKSKASITSAIKDSLGDNEKDDWGPGQSISKSRPEPIVSRNQLTPIVSNLPLLEFSRWLNIHNVFCSTGPGGGVDPSCGKEEGWAANVKLSSEERQAVDDWIGLTGEYRESISSGKPTESAAKFLKVLDKLPVYEGDVYRGMRGDVRDLEGLKVGDTWADKAPMSTSVDRETALKYGTKVLLKIQSRTGRAIPDIEGAEEFGSQREVVTKPGTTYKVVRIRTRAPVAGEGGKQVTVGKMIYLEEGTGK